MAVEIESEVLTGSFSWFNKVMRHELHPTPWNVGIRSNSGSKVCILGAGPDVSLRKSSGMVTAVGCIGNCSAHMLESELKLVPIKLSHHRMPACASTPSEDENSQEKPRLISLLWYLI
jgi:hypothetical protein